MRRAIFYLAANIIMTIIELPFEYTNGVELLLGYCITSSVLALINYIFYIIAYNLVGFHAALTDANSVEMSRLHWLIRFLFALMLYAFTYLPVVSKCLTYIIHLFYTLVQTKYNELIQEITDIFIN